MALALVAYSVGWLLAVATLVVWIFVWLLVAVRVFRRQDIGAGGKVLWIVVILVLPFIGLLIYYLWDAMRPRST